MSHTCSVVGVDPFEASTRSDLFELMQETAPLDSAALRRLAPARPAPARESGRLARESSRRMRRAASERRRPFAG